MTIKSAKRPVLLRLPVLRQQVLSALANTQICHQPRDSWKMTQSHSNQLKIYSTCLFGERQSPEKRGG